MVARITQISALFLGVIVLSLLTVSGAQLVPSPLAVTCPSTGAHAYQSSTSNGKVNCNYDMSNCNGSALLWAPTNSELVPNSNISAACFGNLISGITSISNFSYVLGLSVAGELPLDEDTQAYVVDTSNGHTLGVADLFHLEDVDSDTHTTVTAVFSPAVALNSGSTYALYFCYVGNASQSSDVYVPNLFQSSTATTTTNAASCLQQEYPQDSYYCFTSFDHAADNHVLNEFATIINYNCQASPSPSPSPSPSNSASPSHSASPSRSPSPSASHAPTGSPTPLPSAKPVENVDAGFDTTTPKVTLQSGDSGVAQSVSAGLGGVSSGGVVLQSSTAPATPVVSADGSTKIVYRTTFADNSTLDVDFSFNKGAVAQSFAGTNFTLPAGASKWTVNMQGWPFGRDSVQQSFDISNTLSVGDGEEVSSILVQKDTPQTNMTTFTVYTKSDLAVKLEAFQIVEVDGHVVPMIDVQAAASKTKKSEVEVTLTFPRFATSLNYDPNFYMVTVEQQSSSASTSFNWLRFALGL